MATNKKPKLTLVRMVKFKGFPSGDHECFCWDVTLKTYERITGEKLDKVERGYQKSSFHKKQRRYRLYPNDLIRHLLGEKPDSSEERTFTLSVEISTDASHATNRSEIKSQGKGRRTKTIQKKGKTVQKGKGR